LGACALVAFWPLFVTLAVVGLLRGLQGGIGFDKSRIEAQQRRQSLLAHARYEHWLLMQGIPQKRLGSTRQRSNSAATAGAVLCGKILGFRG
jgi:hypothetical protein